MKRAFVIATTVLAIIACRDATSPLPVKSGPMLDQQATSSGPTVAADKADYMPGDTVGVTGTGWQAGETVILVFAEEPAAHEPDTLRAVADTGGAIGSREYPIDVHDFGRSFTLTATGLTSGLTAHTTFEDGHSISSVSPASGPMTGGNVVVIGGAFPSQVLVRIDLDWDWWMLTWTFTFVYDGLYYVVGFGGPAAAIIAKNDAAITVVATPAAAPGYVQGVVFACTATDHQCHPQYFGYTYYDPNVAPIANAGGPYAAPEGSPVAFNARGSSDADGDPLTFDWNFGDGSVAPNSGPTPAHGYADNGSFTAAVTVHDNHGHSSTAYAAVTVANVAPSVGAIPGAQILQGETYSASGSFTDPGADTHAGSVTWGDGSSASLGLSGKNFTLNHTYTRDGTFTVTVRITDDDGGVGTTSSQVTVINSPPVAVPGGPYGGNEGSPVALNASGSWDRERDPLTFDWDFGDGSVALNSGPTPSHTYRDNGSFTATVTVHDDHSHAVSASAAVTVANVAPSVSAIQGAEILQGETYTATGSFTDPGADTYDATIDFGDGTAMPLGLGGWSFNQSHTYASVGTFTVTVRITDDDGGTGTTSALVTVLSPAGGAQALGTVIQQLMSQGALPPTVATPLLSSADAAAASLARGNTSAASGQLGAFINKVEAAVKTGKISDAVGAELIAYAQRVLRSIGV